VKSLLINIIFNGKIYFWCNSGNYKNLL